MRGPALASMAWRNIWRNRRRTLITLSSIAFGTFLAVLFTGIGDSTYSKMIDLAARLGGGHVSLLHPEYLERPSLTRTVRRVESKRRRALEDRDVKRTVTRVTGSTMLSTARGSSGAGFIAIDPMAEDENTFALMQDLVEGALFTSSRSSGIILGKRLAKNLGLCLLPLDTVRETLGYAGDEGTQVALFIDDQRSSEDVQGRLRGFFEPETAVHTWAETQPDLAGFIDMKVKGANFFEFIIMILVAAGIFNTLFVSVMERLREFGVMTAVGFSPAGLFRLVMWESFWIGLCGLICSAIVTIGPYMYLNRFGLDLSAMMGEGNTEVAGVAIPPVMYVDIFPENLLAIGLAVFLATLLSGLYPAWRAGRVVPVETIRLV